ncbi:MAG: EscU/YscU/HrcU family type III secretion system export apparatus switch protein [Thiobacillaceae bacterium]
MDKANPMRSAAVLAYEEGALAPRVVAKGRGQIADAIIERARSAGLYVHQSRELVSLLMQVDLDSHIPPQLYGVIAELLAWLYQLEQVPSESNTYAANKLR